MSLITDTPGKRSFEPESGVPSIPAVASAARTRRAAPDVIRIVVADEHPIARIGLRKLIASCERFCLVAEAGSSSELLARVRELKPDVVVVDAPACRNPSGASILRLLHASHKTTRVLVLTGSENEEELAEILRLGCFGVVHKGAEPAVLLEALLCVADCERWVDSRFAQLSPGRPAGRKQEPGNVRSLTRRERAIVDLAITGLNNTQIAETLFVAEQTVKNHLHAIFSKTGVTNRLGLSDWLRVNS